MTTTVTSSIGTTGRDYSTPNAWADDCPASLVSDDKIWKGECYNDGTLDLGTSALSIDCATADSTRYMWLTCASGESFRDDADVLTNALRPNQSNGVLIEATSGSMVTPAIIMNSDYAIVENLQINDTRPGNYKTVSGSGVTFFPTLRNCVIKSHQPSVAMDNRRCHFVNLALIVDQAGCQGVAGSSGAQGKIANCTLINTAATPTAKGHGDSWSGVYMLVDNTATFNWGADNQCKSGSNNNAQ